MAGLRAIMVAVDYSDMLAITLPYNQHHFDEVWIITDHKSEEGVAKVVDSLRDPLRIDYCVTDLFYADGAVFNKWRALEWGLDKMGRKGWLCVMDADVLWPKDVQIGGLGQCPDTLGFEYKGNIVLLDPGKLMTPLRRMWDDWPNNGSVRCALHPKTLLPAEKQWVTFPLHRNQAEWAGYSQIFHADDPVLGPPPWHQIDWTHAGGADSLFQRKWPQHLKIRPPWEVLHLGPAGHNWMGRATARADGSIPEGADAKLAAIYGRDGIWRRRQAIRAGGGTEADAFRPERLGG